MDDDYRMGETVAQDRYLAPWDMSPEGMGQLKGSYPYSSLDARELIDRGALRVTQGGGKPSDDPENYSLVTAYNDLQPDSYTRAWANKPVSYEAAQRDLADPASGALYPGKYRQIMWSAQKRGMFE